MIKITSFKNARNEGFDETYAIVRSMKSKSTWIKQMAELSPEWDLFKMYRNLAEHGKWNKNSFHEIYVPKFINDLAADGRKGELLRTFATLSKTNNIQLICFCADESMCHRSIIAGILQGMKAEVETDTKTNYEHYYKMYQEAMDKTLFG